ncbi:hypothetical protein PQU94_15055 [Asticcacaulis sp. DXS10W]|uniref:DNA methylase N-4/N-6 domain-containing protein n=1 Tax=Asticcacaulis currens TaxID=2984210 RepID=A0ABT5IHD1_9CAUL|nr:DNA methyltransferase [Asticcacaulis currens]MDC7695594.1 hypothetical protein [Asticcacaulis currens]
MKPIHPFPARMAPDLALERLSALAPGSLVLDPMSGSGTVLRQAINLGHKAIGFDMDPLAVLMASVWTTASDDHAIEKWAEIAIDNAKALDDGICLPWIDGDPVTTEFVKFWFAEPQRSDLRKLAYVLDILGNTATDGPDRSTLNVLRLALSRIIITKEQGVSLARDTSHSRPHKVSETSTVAVFPAFLKSVKILRKRLSEQPVSGEARVNLGDARRLDLLENDSVDAVFTSPPYLNAIDYLRGHKLALVWLGKNSHELRSIRSNSIGAERAPDSDVGDKYAGIKKAMGAFDAMPKRYISMINRYSEDLYNMVSETARVLKPGGNATFVVGNSCLKGTFVQNAAGVAEAARSVGLKLVVSYERDLPENRRYLPIPSGGSLGKRMRTETICTFEKVEPA